MAHPLFRQIYTTGASITAARFKLAWKSPSLESDKKKKNTRSDSAFGKIILQKRKKMILFWSVLLQEQLQWSSPSFSVGTWKTVCDFSEKCYLAHATIAHISDNTCVFPVHLKRVSDSHCLGQQSSGKEHRQIQSETKRTPENLRNEEAKVQILIVSYEIGDEMVKLLCFLEP